MNGGIRYNEVKFVQFLQKKKKANILKYIEYSKATSCCMNGGIRYNEVKFVQFLQKKKANI